MTDEDEKTGLEALGLTRKRDKPMTSTPTEIETTAMRMAADGEISDLQQQILDHLAFFPDLSDAEVGEDVGTDKSWVNRTRRRHGDIYGLA